MIEFEDDVIDDPQNNRFLVWATDGNQRIRCIASYAFIEDRFRLPDQETMKSNAARLVQSLQPEFEQAILAGTFVTPHDGVISVEAHEKPSSQVSAVG